MNQFLQYVGVRVGMGLVGSLPRTIAVKLGSAMGRAWSVVPNSRRLMVERHGRRLGVPEDRLARHVRDVFGFYGRYWAEVFWTRPRRRPQIEATTTAQGLEPVRRAVADGKGIVFAVPHLGNWEFAGPIATELGFDLVAVAENLKNRRIRDWFVDLRNSMDIEIVLTGTSVARRLDAALRAGKAVALLCDRDLTRRGVEVEFFGERTTIPPGPVRLALATGAPLIPAAVYFNGIGHRIEVLPPVRLDDLPSDLALEQGSQRLAEALESLISVAPSQWHLLQPNWPSDRQGAPAEIVPSR